MTDEKQSTSLPSGASPSSELTEEQLKKEMGHTVSNLNQDNLYSSISDEEAQKILNEIWYTAWDLNQALQHLINVLERCLITDWFILETVAKDIKEREIDLTPNTEGVIVACDYRNFNDVVKRSLVEMSKDMYDTTMHMKDFKIDDHEASWNYMNVPVTIKIIHNKYPFFAMPATEFFRYDIYKIPNPFKAYWQQRGIVK